MKRVYIISKCLKKIKKRNEFHFIGYLDGKRISKVHIYGGEFNVQAEYLIEVEYLEIKNEVLVGRYIKSKELFI